MLPLFAGLDHDLLSYASHIAVMTNLQQCALPLVEIGSWKVFCPDCHWTVILPISTFQLAKITSLSHCPQPSSCTFLMGKISTEWQNFAFYTKHLGDVNLMTNSVCLCLMKFLYVLTEMPCYGYKEKNRRCYPSLMMRNIVSYS